MAHHIAWLASSDSSLFEQFLDTAWGVLHPDAGVAPEGVGDIAAEATILAYAIERRGQLAAFQWFEHIEDSSWVRWEVFFASPASSAPRIGLRALHNRLPAPCPPAWLEPFLPARAFCPATQAMPGFLELVALASAQGSIASTSAAATQTLREQQHETDYLRQLSEDLADELRLVNAKLRDITTQRLATTAFDEGLADTLSSAPPKDLSELRGWALANESRIVVLPRALQGAKKSLYDAPETVYAALELLAGPYRDLRMGRLEHAQFLEALTARELQLEGSVAPSVAGEQGDAYFVSWQGRRRFLELHLRKGGGRDERYCLRIYFFWDELSRKVVVGWLPSHLSNSLS